MARFTGITHCPVTPFTASNALDLDAFCRLLEFHVRHHADAICVCSHEGESFSLSLQERKALVDAAAETLGDRIPLLAHVSTSGTAHAVALARHAQKAGAAGVLVAPPYYWRLKWPDVEQHLRAVAAAVEIEVFLYNVPAYQQGENIPVESILRLAGELPNLAGVVDASFNYEYIAELLHALAQARPGLPVIAAAEYLLPTTAMGLQGALSTVSAIAPGLVAALAQQAREGAASAVDLQHRVSLLRRLVTAQAPAALKAAHGALGRPVGAARRPLRELTDALRFAMQQELERLELQHEPRGWSS